MINGCHGDNLCRRMFRKQFDLLEKRRRNAIFRPLTRKEIDVLLSLRRNGNALYKSAEEFYSEEYRAAQASQASHTQKIEKFRCATSEEANILYCDIHSKAVLEGLE